MCILMKNCEVFTVEDVNRLAGEGVLFRDAYRQVGMAVQQIAYRPTRQVNHTHLGSIGNLPMSRLRSKCGESGSIRREIFKYMFL